MGQWCNMAPMAADLIRQIQMEQKIGKIIGAIAKIFTAVAFIGCTEETVYEKLGYTTVYSNPAGMTTWLPVQELLPRLMVGDLVEFEPSDGQKYTHWAIYKNGSQGQPQVVHLWKASDSFEVRIDDIYFVASGRRARRNNKYDKAFTPQSTEQILDCTRKLLGYSNYHLLQSNCEHFAVFCRNGKSISAQANEAKMDLSSSAPLIGNVALHAVALFHKAKVSIG